MLLPPAGALMTLLTSPLLAPSPPYSLSQCVKAILTAAPEVGNSILIYKRETEAQGSEGLTGPAGLVFPTTAVATPVL